MLKRKMPVELRFYGFFCCYSSLVPFYKQISISCSNENLLIKKYVRSAALCAKMSCEAAESVEDAFLRMARVNYNFLLDRA